MTELAKWDETSTVPVYFIVCLSLKDFFSTVSGGGLKNWDAIKDKNLKALNTGLACRWGGASYSGHKG